MMPGQEQEAQQVAHHHGDDGPQMVMSPNLDSRKVNARAGGIRMFFRKMDQ